MDGDVILRLDRCTGGDIFGVGSWANRTGGSLFVENMTEENTTDLSLDDDANGTENDEHRLRFYENRSDIRLRLSDVRYTWEDDDCSNLAPWRYGSPGVIRHQWGKKGMYRIFVDIYIYIYIISKSPKVSQGF